MPSAEEILGGLHEIANRWRLLAILWHAYFGVGILVLASGIRPSRRLAALFLALPLLSVSALAWAQANPFNGTFFAAAGLALVATGFTFPSAKVRIAAAWLSISGGLMVAFGWVYPHFLDEASPLTYLYAAPTGLIPCPTLSIVIGFSLILGGLSSRPWSLVLAATGVFYGLFGAVRLGVDIDAVLLAGAFLLVVAVAGRRSPVATT